MFYDQQYINDVSNHQSPENIYRDPSLSSNLNRDMGTIPGIIQENTLGDNNSFQGMGNPYMGYATVDKGREVLYGVGTLALLGILFPQFRQKVKTIVTRTTLEGLDLFEKARSLMARAKEDMEDLIAEAKFSELTKRSGE